MYRDVRAWILENDQDGPELLDWSTNQRKPPDTPEQLASEIIWIILCAGRKAQAARTILKKVWAAIDAGRPAVEAFGYRAKAAAIDRAWAERHADFEGMQAALAKNDTFQFIAWCQSIPFIGDDTSFQLGKNCGLDFAKPDIWLCRLCGIPDRPRRRIEVRFAATMELCRYLAEASGDTISNIDSILWLACNKGYLSVDCLGGPVTFVPHTSATGTMIAR